MEIEQSSVAAQPTPAILVSISYEDDGPDSAIWEYVLIWHPVGKANDNGWKSRLVHGTFVHIEGVRPDAG